MNRSMEGRDYNGQDEWSVDAVIRRYEAYCVQFDLPLQRLLRPVISGCGDQRRVWPIMDQVNQGIREDDRACTELGIDFICESKGFPFGRILKSQTARALRKAALTPGQCDRIRARLVEMLVSAYLPEEYRFYVRLFRRTGLGRYEQQLLALVPRGHRMARYVNYVKVLVEQEARAASLALRHARKRGQP